MMDDTECLKAQRLDIITWRMYVGMDRQMAERTALKCQLNVFRQCDVGARLKWGWRGCTNPRHQPQASAGLCTLQWSHTWVQPAGSKPPPARNCRSPAPLLFAWPGPSALGHTHQTCKGNAFQTWRSMNRIHYSLQQSRQRFKLLQVLECTFHRCAHTEGSDQQNQACWCDP